MVEASDAGALAGRRIIVTGAGSGIGRATALALAAAGARVWTCDRAGSEQTAATIAATGGAAQAVPLDVGDEAAWTRLVAQSEGPFEALVNVAGIAGENDGVLTQTIEGWERVMRVNLRGVWFAMRAVLPGMLAAGRGRIVNVSSTTALAGMPGSFAYATSKAAVIGMTRQVAIEFAAKGIRANVVAPGIIHTPMLGDANERSVESMRALTPVRRIGDPAEVAAMIAYLCGDGADFVTGQVFVIDGGWLAQ